MIGKTISHYTIVEQLGEGGMGIVYKAEDTKLKRPVALKFIALQSIEGTEEKARFAHEAQAAAALSHPNICTVYEIDEADGRLFLSMEYIEGESLAARIARGPLGIDEALDVLLQAAQGLDAAHEKGIVHRDIKPANIMIEKSGLVKLMDFGLAKLTGRSRLTREGTKLGTPLYMSPEQAAGKETDRRSDLWSLGAVAYEMIAGRPPFTGDYEQAVMYAIMNDEPEPLTAIRTGVPMALERIVGKTLAKNPAERYQHADDLLADLRALKKSLEAGGVGRTATGARSHLGTAVGTAATARPARRRLARLIVPVCIGAAAIVAFILLRPLLFGEAVSTERHPVAVITFENQTGDPQYDNLKRVIPNLLITSLEQSKYLQVVTWERLRDLARQAGKESVDEIDADLGFELCRREKIDALVVGSFTKLGDRFVTDIKVLDVGSKGSLAVAKADGRGLESIPEQVDRLSRQISHGVGLSERKIDETQRPIIDVTTSSIDAYTYYIKGRDALEKLYYQEAAQNFTKAIEIDSTFAVAYMYLGKAYASSFNFAQAERSYTEALHYSAKATERERLYINAQYAITVEGNRAKGIQVYRELLKRYPREKYAWNFLGSQLRTLGDLREAIACEERALELDPTFGGALNELAYDYLRLEDYEKAIETFQQYIALYPGDANPYDSIAEAYFGLGDLAQATAMYERALSLKPMLGSAVGLAYIRGIYGDYRGAIRWIERDLQSQTFSGQLAVDHCWRAAFYMGLGEFDRAVKEARRVAAIADSTDNIFMTGVGNQIETHALLEHGRLDEARELLETRYFVPVMGPEDSPFMAGYRELCLGLIELAGGNVPAARAAEKRLESLVPVVRARASINGVRAGNWAALLNAEILLAEGRPNEAIGSFASDFKIVLPSMSPELFYANVPLSQDVFPRAYAAKGDLDRAITEYKRLLAFDPVSKDRRLLNPRYEYRLAKLLEKRGRGSEALEHYERFLGYWKDADPDLPELIDAKARAAALGGRRAEAPLDGA